MIFFFITHDKVTSDSTSVMSLHLAFLDFVNHTSGHHRLHTRRDRELSAVGDGLRAALRLAQASANLQWSQFKANIDVGGGRRCESCRTANGDLDVFGTSRTTKS